MGDTLRSALICASYGKLFYKSEKPFVCLMYFR